MAVAGGMEWRELARIARHRGCDQVEVRSGYRVCDREHRCCGAGRHVYVQSTRTARHDRASALGEHHGYEDVRI